MIGATAKILSRSIHPLADLIKDRDARAVMSSLCGLSLVHFTNDTMGPAWQLTALGHRIPMIPSPDFKSHCKDMIDRFPFRDEDVNALKLLDWKILREASNLEILSKMAQDSKQLTFERLLTYGNIGEVMQIIAAAMSINLMRDNGYSFQVEICPGLFFILSPQSPLRMSESEFEAHVKRW